MGRLEANAVMPGMSGAPVLRSRDQMVLGVVSGRYSSTDGWLRDTVWVARTDALLHLLEGVAAPVVQVPIPEAPLDLVLAVDDATVKLSGEDWQVAAPHRGIRPGLVMAVDGVRRARARVGAALRAPAAQTAVAGAALAAKPSQADYARLALGEAGALLAESFLPEPVAKALGQSLASAQAGHQLLRLGVRADGPFARLPWEALPTPDGSGPLGLHPQVALYRRIADAKVAGTSGGPLRILVAIAAPHSGGQALLNYEHELRAVLKAVRSARKSDAQVRIVPFATVAAIRAELEATDVHVLHLSGHGSPGILHLENADGGVHDVSAYEFVDQAIPPDRMPPVISLAACYADVAQAADAPSFAARLCQRGASAVIATETSITDAYATRVFARFYGHLAETGTGEVVSALADARRAVEQELAAPGVDPAGRNAARAQEWAVLTMLAADGAVPLVDPDAPAQAPAWQAHRSVPGLIAREVGEFVGRRTELRAWPAQLAGDSTAGLVIHGIGGIGKTTLANELAVRYADARRAVLLASHIGPADVDAVLNTVARAVRKALFGAGLVDGQLFQAVSACTAGNVPWRERLALLREHVLVQMPLLLLILDNFEDNLTGGPERTVADSELAALLAAWAQDPGDARLLITCRYPFTLPDGAGAALLFHQAAPLSAAETAKLLWALPHLDRLDADQTEQVWRLVGGHPRSLEYLDALLGTGHGRFPGITARLTKAIRRQLGTAAISPWLAAHSQLEAALAQTVTLAADDVLLTDLLTGLHQTPGAVDMLIGTSVYREPVDLNAVLFQTGIPDQTAATIPDRAGAARLIESELARAGIPTGSEIDLQALPEAVLQALIPHIVELNAEPTPPLRPPDGMGQAAAACADSSLLTLIPDQDGAPSQVFVHRWTADELTRHSTAADGPDPLRRAHQAAADYWQWRVQVWPQDGLVDIHDLIEARHHLIAAGDHQAATELSEDLYTRLDDRGAWDQAAALARDTLAWLPADSDRGAGFIAALGELAERHGDYQQAHAMYRQALAVTEALASAAPDNPGYQSDLSITYGRLADLARDVGQDEEAQSLHGKALVIDEALATAAPDNPQYQSDLSITYGKLADLARDTGDAEQAQSLHRKALTIREALATAAPDNPGYQRGLSITYGRLADLARDAGQDEEAQSLHGKALVIDEALATAAPDNPQYQSDLAITYGKLADLVQCRVSSSGVHVAASGVPS